MKGGDNMAVKTTYEVIDFLADNNAFSITASADGETKTISTPTQTVDYILKKYPTRKISFIKGNAMSRADALADFIEDFARFIAYRQDGINKMYDAFITQTYNPIENVFESIEETTETDDDFIHGHKITDSGNDVTRFNTTDSKTGSDTLERDGNDTDTHTVAGFNDQSDYNAGDKNKTDYNSSEETTYDSANSKTGTETLEHGKVETNSGTDARDITTEHTYERHGNIGVSSAQSLIVQSLDLYIRSLADEIIDAFMNQYTYYA